MDLEHDLTSDDYTILTQMIADLRSVLKNSAGGYHLSLTLSMSDCKPTIPNQLFARPLRFLQGSCSVAMSRALRKMSTFSFCKKYISYYPQRAMLTTG